MTSKSSYTAFNSVDDTVAKPVFGSDGAARWQDFRQNNKAVDVNSSVAPLIPLKKLDRALGTHSLKDERVNEAKIRSDAGDRALGEGYTEFKRKNDHEEAAARKKRKMILDRTRPDDAIYFIEAETFEGSKFDYVFTTRDRGTGYYWDGMDSSKTELGQTTGDDGSNNDVGEAVADESDETKDISVKKKKKKKSKQIKDAMVPESDPFNPMEQVAAAIARRNQALLQAPLAAADGDSTRASDAAALGASTQSFNMPSESLEPNMIATGWESAKDPTTGKIYFFNRNTNERSWTKPTQLKETSHGLSHKANDAAALGASVVVPQSSLAGELLEGELLDLGWQPATDVTGKIYYFNRKTDERRWTKPTIQKTTTNQDHDLPEGWKSATDSTTGKVYYFDSSGKTSWQRPGKN